MPNLSKIKREKMLAFLDDLKAQQTDENKIREINVIRNELTAKRYGLVWEEHSERVDEELIDNIPVFIEDRSREITCDENLPYNFLLEGDNLHSLKLLEKTHKGKIDLIYIDPPYNRGMDDFVYDDNYVDKSDLYRHSKWLSFISKRLSIAWELLRLSGVIFISIDDNELYNLKLLCDSLFSENSYVATYMWKKTDTPPSLSNKVRRKYEYVLCYAKALSTEHKFSQGIIDGDDAPLLNSGNPLKVVKFPAGSVHFNIPDGRYSNNTGMKIRLVGDVVVEGGRNKEEFEAEGEWKWQQSTIDNEVECGTYFLVKSTKFSVRYQRGNVNAVKIPQNNINSEVDVGTNEEAAAELENIFNESTIFNYPKPVSLLSYLIRMVNKSKDITVLDFYAGSGTLGQAVCEQNMKDGGSRKFILCTDNFRDLDSSGRYLADNHLIDNRPSIGKKTEYKHWLKTVSEYLSLHNDTVGTDIDDYGISRRITYQRLKTVITGKRKDGSDYSEGIAANLKYFKTGWTKRHPENYFLSHQLLLHIKEMIELQNAIKIDNKKYAVLYSETDFDRYIRDEEKRSLLKKVWISEEITFSAEDKKLLKKVDFAYIPREYFQVELQEVGE